MQAISLGVLGSMLVAACAFGAGKGFETDTITTAKGDLVITFIGHGTLMFAWDGKVVHVDPWSNLADYSTLPKAGLVLVTHEHGDHLDAGAVQQVSTAATVVAASASCAEALKGCTVLANGDARSLAGIPVRVVPAYNIAHKRPNGEAFHPKGRGNGYVLDFGGTRVYVAGDTENIPEMAALKDIDIAFLPMNLPYTMTPEMAAAAVRVVKPRIVYPYHFGETDTARLGALLGDMKGVEVRVRAME